MIWGGRITTLHYDFPWFFDGFSMVFQDFPGFFPHLGVIVMCCRPGSWATVPPLLLTEPMTRSCWRRPQSMQTPNTVPLVFWYVLMCFDVFCSYTSYHFVHCHTCLGDPMGSQRTENGYILSRQCYICYILLLWVVWVLWVLWSILSLHSARPRTSWRWRCFFWKPRQDNGQVTAQRQSSFFETENKEMLKRWSKERENIQKISQSWSRELMYRVWQSVKDSNSWHVGRARLAL